MLTRIQLIYIWCSHHCCQWEQEKTPPANPPRRKPPSGQKTPPAKIPLWPKPPSDQNPPQTKSPLCQKKHLANPLLSLINKYHPKLRLFYIKFRLGGQWHFVLTITITCKFFVHLEGSFCQRWFLAGLGFLSEGGFGRRGGGVVLDSLSMQSCILRRIDCTSCCHSSGSLRTLSHTSM